MAAEKPETTAFPIGNLFAILLLVAGVVANRLPLESARPASEDTTGRQIAGLQDVAVRLWQDPFMAHEKSNAQRREDAGHTLEHFAQNIKALVGDGTLTVLGVSVFGGSYAEDQESRRRTRYAVISALGATAYQPWDAEKIGLIRPTPRESETAGLPPLVPFEVYTDGSRENHHVLVMWLDESYYLAKPLERFAALRETVDEWNPDFQLRIVGPGSSDTIHTLVQQVCGRTAANENAISSFGRIQFFSSSATTRLERLGKLGSGGNTGDALSTDDRPMGGCPEVWFNLLRVTNTDDQLAAALVTELANRGIKPGQPYDPTQDIAHVAFVYEWDNLFSRIWRDEFIEQVRAKSCANANARPPPDPACGAAAALKPPDWIISARYMRGLDGAEARKPSQTKAGANGAAADHKASSKSAARTEDRADGAGQFDYLQRLAEALRAHDAKLREPDAKTEPTDKRAKKQKSSIRAIGIIGNDPYDKLLVLQALRPHFPDAIFFTNDLDARLLQKEQYKWTRNLLVASAFGLQLEPAQQNGTAPFRDSYQTGAFLATRLALTVNEESDFSVLHRCIQARIAPARLFEIGRTFAADISPIGAAASAPSNLAACGDIPLLSETQTGGTPGSLHPATKNLFEWPGKAILGWLSILMLIALLVAMFTSTAAEVPQSLSTG